MVIQRWQSLLLLVAAIMMGCFTFCSLGQVQTERFTFDFTCIGFSYVGEATDGAPSGMYLSTWYAFALSLTTAILLVIDIFLFKNLEIQKRVCMVCLLMVIASAATVGSLGCCVIYGGSISWSSLALSPVLAAISVILAYSCMQRDHRKLKAVDRIR
ncbi:MAG: DUF4293 domain-containing protein [Muribaculaceae bacterium]|nr:DUF4293 domain-containing protein [Muribaculaceae bacterium]